MKIKLVTLFFLSIFLCSAGTTLAEKIFILYDPACMDRLEFNHKRPDGRSDYFVYHVNISSGKKLILEVGSEGSNEQNYLPTPYLSCNNGGFDESLMRRINANIDEVYLVLPKNDRKFLIAPIAIASFYSKEGSMITYESPKYRFRFDSDYGTIGENIAYNNPGVKVYFEGKLENDCEGSYLFRQLSPQSAYPLIDLVLTPEIGVIEERSGSNASTAMNNAITIKQINGQSYERHLREVCGTEPGSTRSASSTVNPSPADYNVVATSPSNVSGLPPGAVPIGGNAATNVSRTPANVNKSPQAIPAPQGEPTAAPVTHKVQRGETLYGISKKYNVSVEDVKTWNNLSSNTIRRDQVLQVASPNAAINMTEVASKGTVPNNSIPAAANRPSNSLPAPYETTAFNNAGATHIVRPGETVASLALKYGYTETRFREINDLGTNDFIKVGQRLKTTDCTCPQNTNSSAISSPGSTSSGLSGGSLNPNTISARTPTSFNQPSMRINTSGTQVATSGSLPANLQSRSPQQSTSSGNYGAIIPQPFESPQSRTMTNLEGSNRAIMPSNTNAYRYTAPVAGQPNSYDTFDQDSGNLNARPDSYYRANSNQRKVHIVQDGESLIGIARQYNTSTERLRQINRMGPADAIIPYQTLYIE